MSITETPKKRPKKTTKKAAKKTAKTQNVVVEEPKVEEKEETIIVKPEAEAESAKVNDVLIEAEKAAQEIMDQTSMLQSGPEVTGKSPETDPSQDPGQADFIPGTRVPDLLHVPERIYDERTGQSRQASLPKVYHYCWVEGSKITQFRIWGYRLCLYDGGSLSGLAPGGFSGTNLYERTLDNKVRHGDVFLMYIPMKGYESLAAADRKKLDDWNMMPKTSMHDVAYRHGVRTFEEVDGVQISN